MLSHAGISSNTPDDAWLPDLIRMLDAVCPAREDRTTTPAHDPERWPDKPGTLIAAEKAVAGWELVAKLQPLLCGTIARCRNHWCRRRRSCRKLAEMAPHTQAARAELAAERAKGQPPAISPAPPRPSKKGRATARPR
jgi:hypothetical protein